MQFIVGFHGVTFSTGLLSMLCNRLRKFLVLMHQAMKLHLFCNWSNSRWTSLLLAVFQVVPVGCCCHNELFSLFFFFCPSLYTKSTLLKIFLANSLGFLGSVDSRKFYKIYSFFLHFFYLYVLYC